METALSNPPASNLSFPNDLEQAPAPARRLLRLVSTPVVVDERETALARRSEQGATELAPELATSGIWESLCSGRLWIRELIDSDERMAAVLETRPEVEHSRYALSKRRREVLCLRLSGHSEKAIAIDLGVSDSTVCTEFYRAQQALAPDPRLFGLTLLLAWIYHAAPHIDRRSSSLELLSAGVPRRYRLEVSQLDYGLFQSLAPAEVTVCRHFLLGRTHAEIAQLRGTKPRTISNQISSIFNKLNVSGRMALMTTLIRRQQSAL